MLKTLQRKGLLKQYLIWGNIALGVILVILLLYWLAAARPSQILQATRMQQYMYYTLDNLPTVANSLQADYIGTKEAVATSLEEELAIKTEPEPDVSTEQDIDKITEDLVRKTNELLAQTEETHSKKPIDVKVSGQAKIALIITNLGLNRRSTELALTLPKQCALGFLPYTKSLKPLLHQAQSNGHEIYIYLPMQTTKASGNPGKYALMTNLTPEENAIRLNIILNSHTHYDGIYSSYKEQFTDSKHAAEMIFDHLDDKNLIFVMGKNANYHAPKYYSKRDNIIQTRIVIDEEPDQEAIAKQLNELVKIAKKEGVALGYAQGFTLTIEMIREWVKTLKHQNVTLVPVSALLKDYNT